MDKIVSVIVPVYNSSKYLKECIDSILGQTLKKIELICVNDGSSDDSAEILEKYADEDKRVHIISKSNDGRGAAAARNLGLECAEGKYVIFLDSDDFFEKDMLERMIESAERTDADMVICRADRFDDRSRKKERDYDGINFDFLPDKEVFNWKDCPDYIFQIADWIVWNKLLRKSLLIENNLFFETIPISDDQYPPSMALMIANRITAINSVFVHYRVNTGCSQVDRLNRHPEAAYLATYSVVKMLREKGFYDYVKKSYLNNVIRVFREYFDRMTDYDALAELYHRYREIEFPRLDALNLSKEFFYDQRLSAWYEMINSTSLEQILLDAARGHGDGMNTTVLRFQMPYSEIVPGSK